MEVQTAEHQGRAFLFITSHLLVALLWLCLVFMERKMQNANYFGMMKCKMPKFSWVCFVPSKMPNFLWGG
jgi:hypothetical protein